MGRGGADFVKRPRAVGKTPPKQCATFGPQPRWRGLSAFRHSAAARPAVAPYQLGHDFI